MISRNTRGTALPETALVIGTALLMVLGAAQMAIIGYTQVGADGAAFAAAHAAAANPSADVATAAGTVFKQFSRTNFASPSPGPAAKAIVVSKTIPGFSLLPGVASNYTLSGSDLEYAPAGGTATPAPFLYSNTAYLYNYCAVGAKMKNNSCGIFPVTTYTMYLAQNVQSGNGNGVNGQWTEWRCHQRYFASVKWDGSRAAAASDTNLDPTVNGSTESAIYGWDTSNTHACK